MEYAKLLWSIDCRGPFPDKGKPIMKWGRKALDQVTHLIACLSKRGCPTAPREHGGLRPATQGGHDVLRKVIRKPHACRPTLPRRVYRVRDRRNLLSCADLWSVAPSS